MQLAAKLQLGQRVMQPYRLPVWSKQSFAAKPVPKQELGNQDSGPGKSANALPPRTLKTPMTTERLQKFLSRAGVASRRTAEEIILAGRVAVNGQVVTAMGVKVDPDRDVVKMDGSIVKVTAARQTVMLHKPYGYVCTTRDPEGRRVVTELLGKMPGRLYPVGRLDYDATGLLLLTNDGELAYRLTHPSYSVPRTYRVTVAGEVSKETVRRTVRRGGPGWPVRLPGSAGEQAGSRKKPCWKSPCMRGATI